MSVQGGRDTKELFTGRSSYYSAGRPSYPGEVVSMLESRGMLKPGSEIADIGSGTGKLSGLFLKHGYRVHGVEPNHDMREESYRAFSGSELFSAVNGTAENTGLPDSSVDLVTAGQAFHWFDPAGAATEFRRILKPGGHVCLVWNDRSEGESESLNNAYEAICEKYGHGYHRSGSRAVGGSAIEGFFSEPPEVITLENKQDLDLNGFRSRYLSSSYAPGKGDIEFNDANREISEVFRRFQKEGVVTIRYDTLVYLGQIR